MIKLKEIRKSKGMTAEELGSKVGVTGNYIYILENGRREASLKILKKIAIVLNTTMDNLVEEVE